MSRSDRRGAHDRDYDNRERKTHSSRPQLNEYWISGEGIHRQVLQTEICKYLGAEATSRPGDYQGVPGFKIKALRPFTPDMLDDLRTASKAFMSENRAYMKRHDRELEYNDSQTYEQTNGQMDYDRSNFAGRNSPAYTSAPGFSGGPVSSAPGYPSSSAGFPASTYAPHSGLVSSSSAGAFGQDHGAYSHPPSRDAHPRDPRDAMMRDGPPGYGGPFSGHSQGGVYHNQGPSYGNDNYANARGGDPRGEPRIAYDNYNGGGAYGGAPPRRQESHFDTMQGMNGPGAGYGVPPARGNGMSSYNDQGYDPYSRGAPVDSRYARR